MATCEECKFFHPVDVEKWPGVGSCRVAHPTVVLDRLSKPGVHSTRCHVGFPWVKADGQACGEYKR